MLDPTELQAQLDDERRERIALLTGRAWGKTKAQTLEEARQRRSAIKELERCLRLAGIPNP
jgi:hypothetical protein